MTAVHLEPVLPVVEAVRVVLVVVAVLLARWSASLFVASLLERRRDR